MSIRSYNLGRLSSGKASTCILRKALGIKIGGVVQPETKLVTCRSGLAFYRNSWHKIQGNRRERGWIEV